VTFPEIPRLYAIADRACFADAAALYYFVEELLAAGVTLIQYRNKQGSGREILQEARELRRLVARIRSKTGSGNVGHPDVGHPMLIMNDRADLALAADFDGVHVGQDDLSPAAVRDLIGPDRWLGVSTHNPEQLAWADKTGANYLAIGPVFATGSKQNPDPIIGLDGVRRARQLTRKPLVAIGGITCERAPEVIAAGADSVAVISALVRDPRRAAEEFLACLR
jgi:thiamine-phosphate pyrophosphorylase